MASPFSMGLSGLVLRNVSGYVQDLEVCGEWKEHELQEHARVGRVPDESMMMNTLVRVAVEKMTVLDRFRCAALRTPGNLITDNVQMDTQHKDASYYLARSRPEEFTNEAHGQISLRSKSKTHHYSATNGKPPIPPRLRHGPSLLCRRHITPPPHLGETPASKDALEPAYAGSA